MSNVSRITSNRRRIMGYAEHTVKDHLAPEAAAIARAIFGENPPEKMTFTEVIGALGELLGRSMREEEEADIALVTDRVETQTAREARDEASLALLEETRSYREILQARYGAGMLRRFGIGTPPPITADELARYGRNAVAQMRAHPVDERPLPGVQPIDIAAVAGRIEGRVDTLDAALKDVGRETREDTLAMIRRDKIREEAWRSYQGVANIAEGCFRLIGRGDLGERVRLTSRRRQGIPEQVDEVYEETGKEPPFDPEAAGGIEEPVG